MFKVFFKENIQKLEFREAKTGSDKWHITSQDHILSALISIFFLILKFDL